MISGYVRERPATVGDAYAACRHLVENTVRGFVGKYRRECGFDFEEGVQLAYLAFDQAYHEYKPSKGPFGARVCHDVYYYLFDRMRSEMARRRHLRYFEPVKLARFASRGPRGAAALTAALAGDAREAAECALGAGGGRGARRRLVNGLSARGWSGARIVHAFAQVAAALEPA